MRHVSELPTPAPLIDIDALERNLATMATALPGERMRPHVKAHKCSSLAARQRAHGHQGFTCATLREVEGLAKAGLGHDLLLANEVLDVARIERVAALDARVTFAIDSIETLEAAHRGGIREVLIDVNVGLPRCGCAPEKAGALADAARAKGLEVRGVMGYEGHVVGLPERAKREEGCATAMELLAAAHADVGGPIVSAGGTGTFDCNRVASEIQAGSYALMDTAYSHLDIPFEQALWIGTTVISVAEAYAVADCGLKSLGMDHGNPSLDGKVWFCSDEHTTFAPDRPLSPGDRLRVTPAHIDPTIAYHETLYVIRGDEVVDEWPVDLRGW